MANIGYARVSSTDQDFDAQIERLKADGCKSVFAEKASGKTATVGTSSTRRCERCSPAIPS
jgi:DNA invertase Pin-like site-specific DNA recombinase